ncbi:hypothetical protein EDC05_001994 [Coemansia umbellata]|uniref:Uncharacterized protein n=1 Tax=Coemansia umbellata TaxID=1424467 RepID=A0ABQ8PQF1_9FUNG|nr:hypothetical protein EDC05_001994 [Coemansia umbellata]
MSTIQQPISAKPSSAILALAPSPNAFSSKDLKTRFVEYLKLLNYRYELVMGLYVMESWEKAIVNAIVFVCIAFILRMLFSSIPAEIKSAYV